MLRLAKLSDIEAIADIHVTSWRETYAGIVNVQILNQLCVEDSIKLWTTVLGDLTQKIYVYEKNHQVLGFADFYFPKQSQIGEIRAIYLPKHIQGLGIGRQFMHLAFDIFRELDFKYVDLNVFNKNPARYFYEHLGGILIGEHDTPEYGAHVKDYTYRFTL